MGLVVAQSGCLPGGAEGGWVREGWSLKLRFFCFLLVWMQALPQVLGPHAPWLWGFARQVA